MLAKLNALWDRRCKFSSFYAPVFSSAVYFKRDSVESKIIYKSQQNRTLELHKSLLSHCYTYNSREQKRWGIFQGEKEKRKSKFDGISCQLLIISRMEVLHESIFHELMCNDLEAIFCLKHDVCFPLFKVSYAVWLCKKKFC